MGEFSIWHWMVVLLVVVLLFGGGKVSSLMGDFAKGIKAFKKNMADDSDPAAAPGAPPQVEVPPASISGPVSEAAPRAPLPEATAAPRTPVREATAAH
jgi:sec-independent protein translocase protein TatA